MRYLPILILSFALTACTLPGSDADGPVDLATLAPLSSKEQALIYGADGAMQQGNLSAAERDYLTAVSMKSGHIEAHLALAKLYDKQNDAEKERAILDRALNLQPDNPLANYILGKLDLDNFQYNDAITHFDRGLKQRPDDLDLNVGKGVANDMLGQHSAAQLVYVRAMRMNPSANLTNLRTNLAMSYLLSGEPKKAAELLEPEVRKPNASNVARHNLALAYGTLGRNTDARKLINGEMDEETRMLAIARLKEYWKARDNDSHTSPLQPNINAILAPEDADTPAVKKAKPVKVGLPASSPLAKAVKANEAAKKAKPVEKPVAAPAATPQ